ncbi:MAG: hypothetical protein WB439_12765, partial [Acidobacteriaceae bacterium]
NLFAREDRKGIPLLSVATNQSQIELLKKLLERMPEPLWMLYVLRVSRGEGELGRYQSVDTFLRIDIEAFLDRYRNFLEGDARHNFWIKSLEGPALLVLDEHNLIYCYGPVNEWASELQETGWQEVSQNEVVLPNPHQHHYHAILDDDARKILESVEWVHSPLQEYEH